jgi:hypothetical protein
LILENEEQRRAISDHIVEFSLAAMETLAHKKHEQAEECKE